MASCLASRTLLLLLLQLDVGDGGVIKSIMCWITAGAEVLDLDPLWAASIIDNRYVLPGETD